MGKRRRHHSELIVAAAIWNFHCGVVAGEPLGDLGKPQQGLGDAPSTMAITSTSAAAMIWRWRSERSSAEAVTCSLAWLAAYITSSSLPSCGVVVSTHCSVAIEYLPPASLAFFISSASVRKSLK